MVQIYSVQTFLMMNRMVNFTTYPPTAAQAMSIGLEEIAGGIGIDSCASDNVMARRHLRGYQIKSSEGSRRGQKWGSASGHSIPNEGEVTY